MNQNEIPSKFVSILNSTIQKAFKLERKYELLNNDERFQLEKSLKILKDLKKTHVIEMFISKTYKKWGYVRKRDLDMIISIASNNEVFKGIIPSLTKKDSDGNFLVSEDERETIWKELDKLIILAIRYIDKVSWFYIKEKYEITGIDPPMDVIKKSWKIQ